MSDTSDPEHPTGSAGGDGTMVERPLFPLQRVLFPGVSLALRIFEQRYLRLVRESLAADTGFGVAPILSGREVGAPPVIARCGTWARITDWTTLPGGLLGIEIRGEQRLEIGATRVDGDGLMHGNLVFEPEEESIPLTEREADLVALHEDLLRHVGAAAGNPGDELDAAALAWRLADLLPVAVARKAALLEMADPAARLWEVRRWVAELATR